MAHDFGSTATKREYVRKQLEDIFHGKFDDFANKSFNQSGSFRIWKNIYKQSRSTANPNHRKGSPINPEVKDMIQTMVTVEEPLAPLPTLMRMEKVKESHNVYPSSSSSELNRVTPNNNLEKRKREKKPEEDVVVKQKRRKQDVVEEAVKQISPEKTSEPAISPDSGVNSNEASDGGQSVEEILSRMNFELSPLLSPLRTMSPIPEKRQKLRPEDAEIKSRKRERSGSVASVSTVSSIASTSTHGKSSQRKEKKVEVKLDEKATQKDKKSSQKVSEPLLSSDSSSSEDEAEPKENIESSKSQVSLKKIKPEKLQKLFAVAKKHNRLKAIEQEEKPKKMSVEVPIIKEPLKDEETDKEKKKKEKEKKKKPVEKQLLRVDKLKEEHTPRDSPRPSSSMSMSEQSSNTSGTFLNVPMSSGPPTAKTTPRPESRADSAGPAWHCVWSSAVPTTAEVLPVPSNPTDSKFEFYQKLAKKHKHRADKCDNPLWRVLDYMTSTAYFMISSKNCISKNNTKMEQSMMKDTASFFFMSIYQFTKFKEDNPVMQSPLLQHFLPRIKILGQWIMAMIMHQQYTHRQELLWKWQPTVERLVEQVAQDGVRRMKEAAKESSKPTDPPFPAKHVDSLRNHMKASKLCTISVKYWMDADALGSMVDPFFISGIEKVTGIHLSTRISVESFASFVLTAVAALGKEYELESKQPEPQAAKMKPIMELTMKYPWYQIDSVATATQKPQQPPPQQK